MTLTFKEVLAQFESLANPENVKGMASFGINTQNSYGVSLPNIREIAKLIKKDHELAAQCWDSGNHEARLLASIIDDPRLVSEMQMEAWVHDFDSWDICDQVCSNLFDKTPFAFQKALEWSECKEEFIKRAGFVLIATSAVHNKKALDDNFIRFFPIIVREATDGRNFVKKAVNWALRQIGKRNLRLNELAIATAKEIQAIDSKAARWIASDALRELTLPQIQNKLKK